MPEDVPVSEIPGGLSLEDSPSFSLEPKEEEQSLEQKVATTQVKSKGAFSPESLTAAPSMEPPGVEKDWPMTLEPIDPAGSDLGPLASQVSAEGLINPAITPTQQAIQARAETVPTDEEARTLMNSLRPGMDAHEIATIDQRLQAYFEDQRNRRDFDNAERLSQIFDPKDPSGRRDFSRQPNVKRVLDMYPDDTGKNLAVDQIAVDAFLKQQAGRDLSDAELEAHRHRFGQEMTGNPTTSYTSMVGLIQKHFGRRSQVKEMSKELSSLAVKDLIESVGSGEAPNSLKTLKAMQSKYPEIVNERTQSQVFALYQDEQRETQKTLANNLPAARAFYNLANKELASATEQTDIDAAVAAARSMSSADRQKVFSAVTDAVTVGAVDKAAVQEVVSNIGKMLGRGVGGRITQTKRAIDDASLSAEIKALGERTAMIDEQGGVWSKEARQESRIPIGGLRNPTEEERQKLYDERIARKQDNQIMREWDANYAQKVDPYKSALPTEFQKSGMGKFIKAIEMGGYQFGEQFPTMALTAVPGIGLGLTTASIAASYYDDMMIKDPGMDTHAALAIATLAGSIESVIEKLQLNSFTGNGLAQKVFLSNLRTKGPVAFMKEFGKTTFEQNLEEAVQDFSTMAIQTFAANQRDDMKNRAWATEISQFFEDRVDVAAMMFIPSAVGAGAMTWRHIKDPDREVFSPSRMTEIGISKKWQERILATTDRDARDAVFREAYDARTKTDIKAGIAQVVGRLAQEKAELEQTTIPKATLESTVNNKGERNYSIIGPTGSVIATGLNREVAESQLAQINQDLASRYVAGAATQTEAEEQARASAEAEAELEVLDIEGKEVAETSPAATIDFEAPAATAPAADAGLTRLNAKVQKEAPGLNVREVIPSETQASPVGQAVMNAVRALESFTGRKVRFVEDVNGNELFFRGVVDPSDPNTIWIDARGTRSTLAIFGHEFTHTLEKTNPALYAEFVQAITPFIGDIEAERAKIAKQHGGKYKEAQLTKEYLANVVGDAFAHPELLAKLAKSNPSLFSRIITALKEWFQTFKEHVSTFGTEAGVDVGKVQEQVVSLLEKVKTTPAETAIPLEAKGEDLEYALQPSPKIGSENWKDWFKQSVVVDAKGNPLIVYHGTKGNFTIFKTTRDIGFHFGTLKAATDRLKGITGELSSEDSEGANIMPVYLSLQNPVRLPDLFSWHDDTVMVALKEAGVFTEMDIRGITSQFYYKEDKTRGIVAALKEKGYDGVVYKNEGEGRRVPTAEEVDAMEAAGQIDVVEKPELRQLYGEEYRYEARVVKGPFLGSGIAGGRGTTAEEARRAVRQDLFRTRLPLDDSYIVFDPDQAKSATSSGYTRGEADIQFARRPGKFEQAKAEGPLDRGVSIEAIFEQIHGSPQRKAETTARAYRAYQAVAARHEAEIAGYQPPAVPDLGKAITELEAQEELAKQNLDLEEQAEIDASIQAASDEYDGPIADARDAVAQKALEREKRLFLSRKRKGIEAVYAERAKAQANEFAIRRQNLKTTVAQAQTMATAEGSAELKRRRRVQTFAELNAILRAIPSDIRGKLGIGMTPSLEGMTEEQLVDFLGDRLKRIGTELERAIKADFIASIEELLDRAEPKKSKGGVLKGAVGEAHRALQQIRQFKDMDNNTVALEIAGLEAQLTTPLDPEEQSRLAERQHLLMLFGDLGNQTAAELEVAHAVLQTIIQQGRTQWYLLEKARLDKQSIQSQQLVDALGTASPAELAKMRREEGFGAIAGGYINSHYSFFQFLEQQLPNLPFIKEWAERARKANTASEDFSRKASDRFTDAIRAAIGSNKVWETGAAVESLQKATVVGKDPQPMTKMEAIQYLLSWSQSDVREKMENHGWTEAHIQKLRDATKDNVSQAVMTFLAKEYEATWAILNPVYKAMYGVDMPKIPNYAPSRYHHAGQEQEVNIFGGATATSGITPNFVHARINHKAQLRQMDAMHVYMQHMSQVGSFTSFAELIREMRGTLNNADAKMALEKSLGTANYKSLNMWIDSIQRNGSNKAAETLAVEKMVNYMTKVKAVSAMAFNLKTALMQVDSALRFMAEVPIKAWFSIFTDPNLYANVPKVWHSETIQRRVREGMTPDMQYLMQQGNLSPSKFLLFARAGFWHIRQLDGVFTSMSSAAVFTYHYNELVKAGTPVAEAEALALDKMDAAVARYSQPTMMTAKGLIGVNGNALFKMVAMFMSDPMLKTSIMSHAFQQILKGNDLGMNFQRIGAVMVWAMASQLLANIYRDWATDDEDEDIWTIGGFVRAAALAPVQGWFLAGSAAESTVALLTGTPPPMKKVDLFTEYADRAHRTYRHLDEALNFDDYPAMIKEWDNILKTLSIVPYVAPVAAVGNIVKPVAGAIENIKEVNP